MRCRHVDVGCRGTESGGGVQAKGYGGVEVWISGARGMLQTWGRGGVEL